MIQCCQHAALCLISKSVCFYEHKPQEILWLSYPEMCENQLKYMPVSYISLTLFLCIVCNIGKNNVHKMNISVLIDILPSAVLR